VNIFKYIFLSYLQAFKVAEVLRKGDVQRAGLYAGWKLEFLLPVTAAE
jgi:hypothetical protein